MALLGVLLSWCQPFTLTIFTLVNTTTAGQVSSVQLIQWHIQSTNCITEALRSTPAPVSPCPCPPTPPRRGARPTPTPTRSSSRTVKVCIETCYSNINVATATVHIHRSHLAIPRHSPGRRLRHLPHGGGGAQVDQRQDGDRHQGPPQPHSAGACHGVV